MLIAGPATVVVAGFITLWMAVVSDDGLVTDDYYKQGLAVIKACRAIKGPPTLACMAT
ncbi:MAG: FixH family protein [Betaproteobacteria bacterium]|nr:FixH family protein [Betaproteobacteria bacterium]